MSPRKELHHDDRDEQIGRRELQRERKESRRRAKGKPEPSAVAGEIRSSLWLYRQINGLSQEQLAERLGMKQPQIARLESGFVSPSIDTLARISQHLGIDFTIEVTSGTVSAGSTRRESRPA